MGAAAEGAQRAARAPLTLSFSATLSGYACSSARTCATVPSSLPQRECRGGRSGGSCRTHRHKHNRNHMKAMQRVRADGEREGRGGGLWWPT